MAIPQSARLLRTARERAGLSQRELARRAGTAQSVIARIERGSCDPGWATLSRILRRAGFELDIELRPARRRRSHMLADVPRILALTPEQRLLELRNADRFFAAATRVCLADILRSKLASKRPQDQQDAEVIRQMLQRRAERP